MKQLTIVIFAGSLFAQDKPIVVQPVWVSPPQEIQYPKITDPRAQSDPQTVFGGGYFCNCHHKKKKRKVAK